MIKRLRKLGKCRALILEKPILDLMGVDQTGLVQVTLKNGSLIVSPVNPRPVSKEHFEKSLDRVMKTRANLLKRLSDN
jgi:antitoxin component of MazEF toxin-antitoxin module